ncbi:MAG: phospholipase D family protein [Verrucomicrobia bacterium]|nr:phospholipase D family protein [Verrucomicrobiota bacterium]
MTIKFLDRGWATAIQEAAQAGHAELRIVCPFIMEQAAKRLLKAGAKPAIRVITRFNLDDFCSGVSSTSALRWLMEQGAEIRGVKSLHSKVYLFGPNHAIVTSANLTEAALRQNHEFGFVSKDPTVSAECRRYFEALWTVAGESLTEERLRGWEQKIEEIKVKALPAARVLGLGDEGTDVRLAEALLSKSGLFSATVPTQVAESDQAFVKFFGEGHNRAGMDWPVLAEADSNGSHWACSYPKNKRPRKVRDGALMFMGRMMQGGDTMIYGRAIGMAYKSRRDDASKADVAKRGWKKTWPHYIRVHHPEFVEGTLGNGVSLAELMDRLGAQAFASTQRNLAKGTGNTNPRRAYRQQAAVELSQEGAEWVNARLEAAFALHGRIPQEKIDALDLPQFSS